MRISDWSSDVCSSDLSLGHEVTIAARHSAQEQSALASLPILIGDYVANDFTREQLADFDALVFAVGNDIRHIEKDADAAAHWRTEERRVGQGCGGSGRTRG